MRWIAWLLLVAGCGWADEASDKIAIRQTLERLNVHREWSAQFTAGADGKPQLEDALQAPHAEVLSGDYWPFWPFAPAVQVAKIQIVTADVAVVDGRAGAHRLLFVMHREEGAWKIAAVRFLREW